MRTLINEGHMIADVGSGRGQGGVSDRFGKAGDRVDRDAALRAVSTHGVDLRGFYVVAHWRGGVHADPIMDPRHAWMLSVPTP
ncbi:hypothetical protein [Stenotrophomonas sp. BIGb0135]|uniref:hypothetical protein n=1 Tax=Stenotrophomonas sp. BIGb0135 TaxID=2940620 RepID=UPI0021682A23|nr:hypothetical protein [Stenotrophomonas sp. BIGb0135]MCS4234718.1 hypothetical protein [Stenotrophomonas sp. BIGb0135]